jgi:hypothetical protein
MQSPSHEVDGDTATTRRRDEITRGDLKRTWPNYVALPVEKLRDRVNRELIFCAAGARSATPFTYSLRRDDSEAIRMEATTAPIAFLGPRRALDAMM